LAEVAAVAAPGPRIRHCRRFALPRTIATSPTPSRSSSRSSRRGGPGPIGGRHEVAPCVDRRAARVPRPRRLDPQLGRRRRRRRRRMRAAAACTREQLHEVQGVASGRHQRVAAQPASGAGVRRQQPVGPGRGRRGGVGARGRRGGTSGPRRAPGGASDARPPNRGGTKHVAHKSRMQLQVRKEGTAQSGLETTTHRDAHTSK
jgi:hypothetical protein